MKFLCNPALLFTWPNSPTYLYGRQTFAQLKLSTVPPLTWYLFVCFKGSRWGYACHLTDVSVYAEIPIGQGIPP